jgi:predicted DNA binding CopG/RHH family protein
MVIDALSRTRARAGRYSGKYEVVGNVELPAAEAEEAERQINQADSEITEAHVTLRWGRRQLDIVRRAARLSGVPYQTYLKQATMQRAIEDLRVARAAGIELP